MTDNYHSYMMFLLHVRLVERTHAYIDYWVEDGRHIVGLPFIKTRTVLHSCTNEPSVAARNRGVMANGRGLVR